MPRALRVLLFALASLLCWAARARAEGVLLVAHGPPTDPKLLPLTRTEVKADVAGDVVSSTVTQTFRNPYAEKIEAMYVFPLPNHAAVDDMEMHIGARVVKADVQRRNEAQVNYDAAVRRGQRAALLEQERPNIFTFSVGNIDPGSEIKVTLHYFELAKYDHGTYEMTFPMVVGPRYVPGTPLQGPQSGTGTKRDTDRVPDASRISPAYVPPTQRSGRSIGLSVHLDAGAPLEVIESPAHEVTQLRASPSVVGVTLKNKDEIPNRDFVLRWRLAAPELRAASFAYRGERAGEGYLALLVEPKHDPLPAEIAPRELFFLLDTSGSMQGAPLATVKAATARALDGMNPSDTFQIIDFADSASSFASRPLPNTAENVARAKGYLANLHASGGTNQLVGIHAALSAPGDERRTRFVVFMTDGYIGNDREVIALTQREIGRARIYGFGVGSSVNRHLLDEVSFVGRGAAEYLRPHEDAKAMIDRFYERIGKPYLTDVTIDWGSLAVTDSVPSKLRDVSALEPMLVLARYQGAGTAAITLKGNLAGRPFAQKLTVSLPDAPSGNVAIGRLWAREKIGELSRDTGRPAREAEITKIALEHHLVSAYTSLVAIDATPSATKATGFPMLVEQPNEAPEGVNLASAGGAYATTTVGPPPPAPEPAAREELDAPRAPAEPSLAYSRAEKRGGCAACAVGSGPGAPAGAVVFALGLVLLAARRRKTS